MNLHLNEHISGDRFVYNWILYPILQSIIKSCGHNQIQTRGLRLWIQGGGKESGGFGFPEDPLFLILRPYHHPQQSDSPINKNKKNQLLEPVTMLKKKLKIREKQ